MFASNFNLCGIHLITQSLEVHIASNQYMLYNIRRSRYNLTFAQGFQRTCQTTTHIHKNSVTKSFVEHTTIFSLVKFLITHTCIAFSIHTVSNKRVLLWFHSLLLNKWYSAIPITSVSDHNKICSTKLSVQRLRYLSNIQT